MIKIPLKKNFMILQFYFFGNQDKSVPSVTGVYRSSMCCLIVFSSSLEKSSFCNFFIVSSSKRYLMTRAGTPPTIAYGGTSRVTTEPAETTAPCPMVTPERIVALAPIQTSEQTTMSPLEIASNCSPAIFTLKGNVEMWFV